MSKKYFIIDKVDNFEHIVEKDTLIIKSDRKSYRIKRVIHSNTFIMQEKENYLPIDEYFELEEVV